MKRSLRIVLMLVAISAAIGSMTELRAQQEPAVGAYQQTSVADRDVRTAARYAVKKVRQTRGVKASLISIEGAEKQVVAGLNYRLCLKVRIRGKVRRVTTVVYKNLEQKHALTSWTQGACGSGT